MVFTAPAGLKVGDEHEFEFLESDLDAAPLAAKVSDHTAAIAEMERKAAEKMSRTRNERLERARCAAKAKRRGENHNTAAGADRDLAPAVGHSHSGTRLSKLPAMPICSIDLTPESAANANAAPATKSPLRRADAFARRPATKKDVRAEQMEQIAAAAGPLGTSETLSAPSRSNALRRADAFARGKHGSKSHVKLPRAMAANSEAEAASAPVGLHDPDDESTNEAMRGLGSTVPAALG